MLHAFALIAVMYKRRRKAIAEIWPKYCLFLACMLTVQYFVCIGIPPAACKGGWRPILGNPGSVIACGCARAVITCMIFISDYPWRFPNSTTDSNVVKWLYVPDFKTKPNSSFLICRWLL